MNNDLDGLEYMLGFWTPDASPTYSRSRMTKAALGVIVQVDYVNTYVHWHWVGVWTENEQAARKVRARLPWWRGWYREEHSNGRTLFARITWNYKKSRRLFVKAKYALSK